MKVHLKNIHIKSLKQKISLEQKKKIILENINLSIGNGDIFGLIGKNGAGKSTLLKIILGLIDPNQGEIVFEGKNNPLFGYSNCNPRSFFWRISTRDNLIFYSKMLGIGKKDIQKKTSNIFQAC